MERILRNDFGYGRLLPLLLGFLMVTLVSMGQEPDESDLEELAGRTEAENLETDESPGGKGVQTPKMDLNTISPGELLETGWVNETQAAAFGKYRALLGKFVSTYEIQAIPGWDMDLIGKLRTYIMVSVGNRWSKGEIRIRPRIENLVVLRAGRLLERSRGYRERDSLGNSHYAGDPNQMYLRYRFSIKGTLRAGFTAEKDAGENFKRGFDFYSFHFMLTTKRWLKWLAVGDYSVNLGQGLVHWQGLSFPLAGDLGLLVKQSQAARAYQSSGESRFHRGLSLGWQIRKWRGTTFVASDRKDANLELGMDGKWVATSIIESGYHRSLSEIGDKDVFHQWSYGGSIGYQGSTWQLNGNLVTYRFNYPIQRQQRPYNIYAVTGASWLNYGFDYQLMLGSVRLFGELARDARGAAGALGGCVLSVDPSFDLGLLYRHLGARYRAIEADALTESSEPANENGIWLGLNLRPNRYFSVAAFADFFSFPWLKFGVDAPSNGTAYLLKADWHPDKQFQLVTSLRLNRRPVSDELENGMRPVVSEGKIRWRNQLNYILSTTWELRSRVELNGIRSDKGQIRRGFLSNSDIFYHPLKSLFSLNARLEWFETDGYDARIYAYETDLPFNYYVPAIFGSGFRYYLNIKISYHSKFTMGLKWAQTWFSGVEKTGSGWDEIIGKKRSDLRAEMLIKF